MTVQEVSPFRQLSGQSPAPSFPRSRCSIFFSNASPCRSVLSLPLSYTYFSISGLSFLITNWVQFRRLNFEMSIGWLWVVVALRIDLGQFVSEQFCSLTLSDWNSLIFRSVCRFMLRIRFFFWFVELDWHFQVKNCKYIYTYMLIFWVCVDELLCLLHFCSQWKSSSAFDLFPEGYQSLTICQDSILVFWFIFLFSTLAPIIVCKKRFGILEMLIRLRLCFSCSLVNIIPHYNLTNMS